MVGTSSKILKGVIIIIFKLIMVNDYYVLRVGRPGIMFGFGFSIENNGIRFQHRLTRQASPQRSQLPHLGRALTDVQEMRQVSWFQHFPKCIRFLGFLNPNGKAR